MMQMRMKMSGKTFEEMISTSDFKGDFIEFVLYDYFESVGFSSRIMKVVDKNGRVDQRLKENRKIIVPDLLCEKRYSEMIFIESKSRWTKDTGGIAYWSIPEETFKSYELFYKEVYSPANQIMKPINFYICFSEVIHDWESRGKAVFYFVRMDDLRNMNPYRERNNPVSVSLEWSKQKIVENHKKKISISFSYDSWNNIIQTKYCSDIYSKQRTTEYFTVNKYKRLFFDWMYENEY